MHSKGLWRPDSEEFSAHPEPSRTPAAHARGRPASSRLLCELLDRILAGVRPGVGAIVALTFAAAIDDPARFRSSRMLRCTRVNMSLNISYRATEDRLVR